VFRLLGSMLGKAMYEGIIVELPLAAFFLKKLRGVSSDLNDLPSLDRQLYRNLLELSKPETNLEALALNFTIQRSAARPDEADVPLMAGGADVIVDRSSLPLYLTLVADYRLNREIAPNASAFLDGFNKLIDQSWLRMFNDRELQQLISGDSRGGFDLDDFREHVQLGGGYHADHPVIGMLWSALSKMSVRQKESFLKFVTACSR
jgi:ubiquitin-protein ligase E3 C